MFETFERFEASNRFSTHARLLACTKPPFNANPYERCCSPNEKEALLIATRARFCLEFGFIFESRLFKMYVFA